VLGAGLDLGVVGSLRDYVEESDLITVEVRSWGEEAHADVEVAEPQENSARKGRELRDRVPVLL